VARRRAIDDPLITTFGRLLEATSGLELRLGRAMEESSGLPVTWFEVLLRVARSDGSRLMMSELSQQLTLTTGGVTRLVDRIVDAGYLRREQAGHDRRVVYAVVTPEGRAVLDAAAADHAAELRDVFAGFSDAEIARLDKYLDRLRGA
jgi:MarR family transcriptional regulator, 2-MHQ and catechol-resistance regulon repressor